MKGQFEEEKREQYVGEFKGNLSLVLKDGEQEELVIRGAMFKTVYNELLFKAEKEKLIKEELVKEEPAVAQKYADPANVRLHQAVLNQIGHLVVNQAMDKHKTFNLNTLRMYEQLIIITRLISVIMNGYVKAGSFGMLSDPEHNGKGRNQLLQKHLKTLTKIDAGRISLLSNIAIKSEPVELMRVVTNEKSALELNKELSLRYRKDDNTKMFLYTLINEEAFRRIKAKIARLHKENL